VRVILELIPTLPLFLLLIPKNMPGFSEARMP
jgi:hypothetical protein